MIRSAQSGSSNKCYLYNWVLFEEANVTIQCPSSNYDWLQKYQTKPMLLWNFLYKTTTAKSCCFIQDKNIGKLQVAFLFAVLLLMSIWSFAK